MEREIQYLPNGQPKISINQEKIKRPTDHIKIGERVRTASGERGTIIAKRWNDFVINIDGLGERIFNWKFVDPE